MNTAFIYKRNREINDLFPSLHKEPTVVVPSAHEELERLFSIGNADNNLSLFHNILDHHQAKIIAEASEDEAYDAMKKFKEERKEHILNEYFGGDVTRFKALDLRHDGLGVIGEKHNLDTYSETRAGSCFFFFRFISAVEGKQEYGELEIGLTLKPFKNVSIAMLLSYVAIEAVKSMVDKQGEGINIDLQSFGFTYDKLPLNLSEIDPFVVQKDKTFEKSRLNLLNKLANLYIDFFRTLEQQDEKYLRIFELGYGSMELQTHPIFDEGQYSEFLNVDHIVDAINDVGCFMSEGVIVKGFDGSIIA